MAQSGQEVGARGEDLAVAELERLGMSIVRRNWRCPLGEIDIVAHEEATQTLVFCEVKCRTGIAFGHPLESITYAKLRKLRQLAAEYLSTQGAWPHQIRLDAIGVVAEKGRTPVLTHVQGIGG